MRKNQGENAYCQCVEHNMRIFMVQLLFNGGDRVLRRRVARSDGVANLQNGVPVRLQKEVGRRPFKQTIKRRGRTKHFRPQLTFNPREFDEIF